MTPSANPGGPVRLVELLAPLSLVTDLGMGSPDEQALRSCLVATNLARRIGLGEAEVADVYYATLLEHLGCTATSHEEAARFGGDELATRPLMSRTDFERPRELIGMLGALGRGTSPIARARTTLSVVTSAKWAIDVMAGVCEVGATLARQLHLSQSVELSLGQMFERWDGKGAPNGLRGDATQRPARLAQVASQAVTIAGVAGVDEALAAVRRRSGGWFDPKLSEAFVREGPELLSEAMGTDALQAVVAAEPGPWRLVQEDRVDELAAVFGRMIDLKSTYLLGHSDGVAALVHEAARALGLSDEDRARVRQAGFLHDLGRVGVPAGIWEKRGSLTQGEWERVRLHAYHSERILARSPGLSGVAGMAGMHHERTDGSGYHRQARGGAVPQGARVLAAADAFHAMTEPRPYRPALASDAAADALRGEARQGRFDARATDAVIACAGKAGG
ncbi:MAG: HD domain-containing protein, partial [Chloroflexi bacterium]|nr:HD domain-containing protein [Chloroflexota bacterium]